MTRYFLKPTNKKLKKQKFYGFDVETYGNYNKFLMGSIVDDKEKFVFWNKKEMQNFIFSKKLRNSVLWATNLGFDFLTLFGEDFNLMSKFDLCIKGSDFINIKYLDKYNHSMNLRDTMNFLHLGVENLGKILNIPKLDKPKFLGKIPNTKEERKLLENYNIRDSLISYKFAKFLRDSFYNIGANMEYTIASTSMNLFRNKYLKLWLLQPEKYLLRVMQNSYYGGRTEIFKRGLIKEKIFIYDVNSLYPSVMKNNLFPDTNTLTIEYKPKLFHVYEYDGISFCKIKAPKDIYYPLLPYRTNDKLLFPLGKFSSWQSHIELRKALNLGYEIEPIYTIYYKRNINLFSDFVTDLYNERMKNKDNNLNIVYKLILNSLFGKFSQRLEYSNILFTENKNHMKLMSKAIKENIDLENNKKPFRYKITPAENRIIEVNGISYDKPRIIYIQDLNADIYPKFINPIISIYITSYARLKLYEYFEKVIKNNGNVYYCDTDSIFTDIKLKTSDRLGKLKLEKETEEAILVKPKFYYLKTNDKEYFKLKGLMNVNSYEQFKNILNDKKYSYQKFTKFKESIKRKLGFNQIIQVEKLFDFDDDKRNWNNKKFTLDFQDSKPIII